ncbi:MAG: NADH-quinone oxidoreductase subunit N [Deltaproteobacteria bacterium]|nr:NADH-quinone oxidoreductase subunit N [Deltaproteobacteria bacterium]
MPADFLNFLPEATTLIAALFALVVAMVANNGRATWWTSLVGAVAVVVTSAMGLSSQGEPFFPGIYQVDAFSQLMKIALAIGLLVVTLLASRRDGIRQVARGDYPVFLLLATAGMMILVSATEMLTLFVALEMSAYALYVLAALGKRADRGSEAAAKYVVFGGAASAVSLYGMSLIYGTTGTTYLAAIAAAPAAVMSSPMFMVGLFLLLAGLFFKLAVFPFHSWAPDVYEAAPHESVAFIATASKVAAVGVIARVLCLAVPDSEVLITTLLILCVVSMTFGNLAAIAQRDIKRLLAYSTIAHAGYILIGLLTLSHTGMSAAIFYGVIYLAMGLCAFTVVCALGADGAPVTFDSLAGLHKRSPFLGALLLVGLFGLAGIPPTPGFAGKWFLFAAALEQGHFWLVLIAAINATISLYYYLIVVKAAYTTEAADEEALVAPTAVLAAGGLSMALVVYFGLFPGELWTMAEAAATAIGAR